MEVILELISQCNFRKNLLVISEALLLYLTLVRRNRQEFNVIRFRRRRAGAGFSASEEVIWARTEQLLTRSHEKVEQALDDYQANTSQDNIVEIERLKEVLLAVARNVVSVKQRYYTSHSLMTFR